jgi:hypothetical protein
VDVAKSFTGVGHFYLLIYFYRHLFSEWEARPLDDRRDSSPFQAVWFHEINDTLQARYKEDGT